MPKDKKIMQNDLIFELKFDNILSVGCKATN